MNLFFQHLFHLCYVQFFVFSLGFQFGCENYVSETVRSKGKGGGVGGGAYGDVEKKDNHLFI